MQTAPLEARHVPIWRNKTAIKIFWYVLAAEILIGAVVWMITSHCMADGYYVPAAY